MLSNYLILVVIIIMFVKGYVRSLFLSPSKWSWSLHIKRVFLFSLQLFSETYLILRTNE